MTMTQTIDALSPDRIAPGPVTRARLRRTFVLYAALCVLGLLPSVLALSPALQAAGLGLLFPGAGFIAVGGWALLLIPVTLALFAVAFVAWFGAALLPAPILVWFGSAALAGALVGDSVWAGAPYVAAGCVALGFLYGARKWGEKRAAQLKKREERAENANRAVAAAKAVAVARPAFDRRELSLDELAHARYALDRALQPIDKFDGFDVIDIFQTAAVRYQINYLGYTLSLLNTQYTPNFHGYLAQAQRNLIEKYLQKKVWNYWVYETAWGHGNLFDFDPVRHDNIMLTGFFGNQVGMYQIATGDTRYAEPGSLTFKLSARTQFKHDLHSINKALIDNNNRSAFCLFPCEPNWVYPGCNFKGMTSLMNYDQLFKAGYTRQLLPRWHESLVNEFTDLTGAIISLRSTLTGFDLPFPASELSYAIMGHPLVPEHAWKMWALARHDLLKAVKDENGKKVLAIPNDGVDFGNYRAGKLVFAAGTILLNAREFGDETLADAAKNTLDLHCGRTETDGVVSYAKGSNLANLSAILGRIARRDDWKETTLNGPALCTRDGPLLEDIKYPDALVARAFSHGADLELVLHRGTGAQRQRIGLARLHPGQAYTVTGATPERFTADAAGRAWLEVDLAGRTEIVVKPAGH